MKNADIDLGVNVTNYFSLIKPEFGNLLNKKRPHHLEVSNVEAFKRFGWRTSKKDKKQNGNYKLSLHIWFLQAIT